MECGRCGGTNPAGKSFCGDCGAALRVACPSCGSAIEAGKRFCGDCGAPLVAAPAPAHVTAGDDALARPAVDAIQSERRHCTIVFVDLVGFTTVSEARDPEAVRDLLSKYFETASTVVGRYGGTIEKFIGDAVMAVWGTPVATEADAERAVRAAIDLVESVGVLGAEHGADGLRARAGVLTGEVAVRLDAVNEGMVAGDAVNTASRVQAAAEPGSVFVDATTRRLTASAIAYRDEGDHTLKGKAEPEHLWRALRVVSAIGGEQRVDGLEAPLTGRGAELRAIREMMHASAERRQPRLMLVSGAAGVGKSRLGWEFEKYTDGLADTVWWHRGRCLSYGDGLVYWAFAEAVRQRLSIAEEDAPDVVNLRLAEGLERHVPDPADRQFIGIRLARLLGVRYPGDAGAALSRDDLFAGWRRFVEQLAAAAPFVLLVEDAHHAAPELLDFLEHLVDWVRDLPVFVLVFARPELEQTRPGFAAGRNRATITLDPLDATAMGEIVDELVPEAPRAARDAIVGRAEGIPLYAVESIRALIDRELIKPVEGVYRFVGDVGALGELQVPDTLHALLTARLDALDPTSRRVVADCAVLGTGFALDAVAAISGLDADTTRDVLSGLLRREVLEVYADSLSPERGSYRFAQGMLRQVAYDTMARRDRRARHLAVAAYLRQAFANDGEEVVDAIARHYTDALEAVPDDPDNPTICELAVDALVKAAERSLAAAGEVRASAYFADAAVLLDGVGRRADAAMLRLRAAEAAADGVDHERGEPLARSAREVLLDEGDAAGAAKALTLVAQHVYLSGRLSDAVELAREALAEVGPEPSLERMSALRTLTGAELFHAEIVDSVIDGEACTTEALHIAHQLGCDDETYSRLFGMRGLYFDFVGDHRQAVLYLDAAFRLAEQTGSLRSQLHSLSNLTNSLLVNDPAAAVGAATRVYDIARELGSPADWPLAACNLALALMAIGDWDAALAEIYSADLNAVDRPDPLLYTMRAQLTAMRGEPDVEALALADDQIIRDNVQMLSGFELAAACVADALGDRERALTHALAVLELIERGVATLAGDDGRWGWPLAARLAHDLGRFDVEADVLAMLDRQPRGHPARMQLAEGELIRARLADVGRGVGAAEMYETAITALRADSTPFHLAHGLLDHAEHLARGVGGAESAGRAAALVAEADTLGERLGCQPLRSRASALDLSSLLAR